MKRYFVLLLAFAILLSCAACSQDAQPTATVNSPSYENTNPGTSQSAKPPETQAPTETMPVTPEAWGKEDHYTADNGNGLELFYINFPHYGGTNEGCGKVANQQDGTGVVLSGQNRIAPEISSLSELFPAYFDHLQYTLEAYYGVLTDNYTFSLAESAAVTVNDYEMYRFTGTFAFDEKKEHREYQFVAYATALKSNGAYAYWVVYDNTEDQSNGNLIAQHALNMAKTFREEK